MSTSSTHKLRPGVASSPHKASYGLMRKHEEACLTCSTEAQRHHACWWDLLCRALQGMSTKKGTNMWPMPLPLCQTKAAQHRRKEALEGLKLFCGVADTLSEARCSRQGTKKWGTSEGEATRLALATTGSLGQERSSSATLGAAMSATSAPKRWCNRRQVIPTTSL